MVSNIWFQFLNAIGIVKYTILDGDAKFVHKRRAFDKAVGKVIILKSRGEVSLVEQNTIECVF